MAKLPLEDGSTFGEYTVIRQVRQGTLGPIYLVRHRFLDRQVVLATLNPEGEAGDQETSRQRFMIEMQAMARVHVPRICPLLEVGEIDGVVYFTMPYIEGPLLSDKVREYASRPPRETVGVVRILADALCGLHRYRVLYGRVRPSNIIIDRDGLPTLLGFGVPECLRLQRLPGMERDRAYLAPEQGDSLCLPGDVRQEVYSLGVVLYELVTGSLPSSEVPKQRSGWRRWFGLQHHGPAPPSTLRDGVDPQLDAICLRALAENPAKRFGSMDEFHAALDGFLRVGRVPAKIFVSYRRDDSADAAGRLHDRLSGHFGVGEVFMDIDAIPVGADFREHLARSLGHCGVLLAVIGDHWLNARVADGPKQGQRRLEDPDDVVRIEIETALEEGIAVIPVLVGRASMPSERDLPGNLRALACRNAAELRSGREFHAHADRLIEGIEHQLRFLKNS